MPDLPKIADLWCDDCEDFWETRIFGQADAEACPHCRGPNVRVMDPVPPYEAVYSSRALREA